MENRAATPKFDDMRMGGNGTNEGPNARKLEAVEPARFLAVMMTRVLGLSVANQSTIEA
jgi:hypothetical protein